MTADEARLKSFKKTKLPEYIKEVNQAIDKGINFIEIGKDTLARDSLKDLGYRIESIYNDDHEMRVEGYKISW